MLESEMHEQRRKRLKSERQAAYKKRQKTKHNTSIKRHELGRMDQVCIHCGAKFWIEERTHDNVKNSQAFTKCCAGGKVSLSPLLEPPLYLLNLYTSLNSDAVSFHKNVRGYKKGRSTSAAAPTLDSPP